MSTRVAVVTDSSANLDPEVAAALGVTVVPLRVVIGVQYLEAGHIELAQSPEARARGMGRCRRKPSWRQLCASRPPGAPS